MIHNNSVGNWFISYQQNKEKCRYDFWWIRIKRLDVFNGPDKNGEQIIETLIMKRLAGSFVHLEIHLPVNLS